MDVIVVQIFDLGVILDPPPNGKAPEHSGYDGDVITPDWVVKYVNSHTKELVVGVEQWYSVRAVRSNNSIILTAKIRAVDVIKDGHFDGQEVTAAWIKGYIEGADVYWMAPGCVKASHVQVTVNEPLSRRLVP
jgi:hypothetical protein